MISQETISNLEKRIRWNEALDSDFPVSLVGDNLTGESGKHFQRFHQLVTVENIYNVGISLIDAEEEQFNSILSDIRKQAVLQVLADSIELNRDYDSEFDYSEKIESNIALFDNAIGYGVAVSVLELLQSSKRINPDERSVQLSMASLKLELEGFTNESGHIVSKGIRYYYQSGIKKISKAFYPTTYAIKSATNNW